MSIQDVLSALSALTNERVKKRYLSEGAQEPLFGVATGAMKPLAKQHMFDQGLAEQLYATGNFDAMYFAGVIADPKHMQPADFDRWIEQAYFWMISDFVVAVTLSETDFAQDVADRWIQSENELTASAGWSCYEWLLGSRGDDEFDVEKMKQLLSKVEQTIHDQPDRIKKTMNRFLVAVGVSFRPLHEDALQAAGNIGEVAVADGKKTKILTSAAETIVNAAVKGRIGFKRKYVRC